MSAATYTPTPTGRLQALKAIDPRAANWRQLRSYTVARNGHGKILYIAGDNWLPDPGETDPIQDEWKEVLAVAERYGMPDTTVIDEPVFDHETSVWVWIVEF
jgi:hypothetical protein